MAFKGKSTIELRNAKTGELEQRVEDENMVTNAAYSLINPNKSIKILVSKENDLRPRAMHDPILKACFGGLLLFEKTITEDVNNILPLDNRNIGHAALGYSGTDQFVGTLNSSESKEINDGKGYRFVWDFATDKANGTIRTVCLTSALGGMLGYRLDTNDFSSKYIISSYRGKIDGSINGDGYGTLISGDPYYRLVGCFGENKFLYASVTKGTNTVNFREVTMLEKCSLNTNYPKTLMEKTVTSTKKLAERKFLQQIDSKLFSIYSYDTNKLDIVVFNGETLEVEKEDTLIIQDAKFKTGSDGYYNCISFNGYYYVFHENGKDIYQIDANDPTNYSVLSVPTQYSDNVLCLYQKILFVIKSGYAPYVFDGQNFNYINSKVCGDSTNNQLPYIINSPFIKPPYILYTFYRYGNDRNYHHDVVLAIWTPFLSTINNLSTPVVKNETQTMKVTYEITEI